MCNFSKHKPDSQVALLVSNEDVSSSMARPLLYTNLQAVVVAATLRKLAFHSFTTRSFRWRIVSEV